MDNGEFIEVLSPKALKDLQALNAEIVKTIAGVKEVNENMISIKTPSGSDSAIKKLTADYDAQEKAIKKLQTQLLKLTETKEKENQSIAKTMRALENETKARQSLEKQKNTALAQQTKEEAALVRAESLYNKIAAKINLLEQEYNNLAARRAFGIQLTDKEAFRLDFLTSKIGRYRDYLKKVDYDIGKFQKNVGNYPMGTFDPLSSSISRVAQELPNLGQSFQIFAMSIGNNVAAFKDAIDQIILKNKILKAEGKETVGVFSSIGKSLFSLNTVMYVAIALFIAYSKEIENFISGGTEASKTIDLLTKAQERYNETSAAIAVNSEQKRIELQRLLAVAKEELKSDSERMSALKSLRSMFPEYLKNLTDEEILRSKTTNQTKSYSQAIQQLTGDLNKRAAAEEKAKKAQETLQDSEDLLQEVGKREKINNKYYDLWKKYGDGQEKLTETEREAIKEQIANRKELLDEDAAFIEKYGKIAINKYGSVSELGIYSDTQITLLRQKAQELRDEYQKQKEESERLFSETSKLDVKDEKAKKSQKERISLNFEESESLYNLKIARLESQKTLYSKVAEDEQNTLEQRLKGREDFSDKAVKIIDLQYKKEAALLIERALDDKEKNDLSLLNREISSSQHAKNIIDIDNRLKNELLTNEVKHYDSINALMDESIAFYRKIEDEKLKIEKAKQDATEKTRDLVIKSAKDAFKRVSDDERNTLQARQRAFEEYLKLARKELDIAKIRELASAKSQEEIDFITQKYAELNRQLNEIESPLYKAQQSTEKWIRSLADGQIEKSLNAIGLSSLKLFLDIDNHGKSTFDKLLEAADTIEERFAVTFQAVGDVAQDAFNTLTELSNQHFQNEYDNLAKQRDIAIMFAGESATAREEIERQYEQRQREIKRREFQAKKQQALFNIAVDTAQAIVGFLANPGGPTGVTLSIAAGIIGALQAGIVASQQAPQFWKGTDNAPEGFAWTQEKGREVILDKSGKLKSTGSDKGAQLTYLNKGDKVLNNDKTMDYLMFNSDLNNILAGNQIGQPVIEVKSNTNFDLSPLVNAINNKESVSIGIDKSGLNIFVANGHQRKQDMNNRFNFIGKSV